MMHNIYFCVVSILFLAKHDWLKWSYNKFEMHVLLS